MTQEWYAQVVSYRAGEAFAPGDRFRFVKLNADGDIVKVTATTDRAIGVLRDDTREQNDGSTVGVYEGDGLASVELSAAVAVNDLVGLSANGRGTKLTPGTDTTKYVHGVATEAGVAGDRVLVHIVIPTTTA